PAPVAGLRPERERPQRAGQRLRAVREPPLVEARPQLLGKPPQTVEERQGLPLPDEGLDPVALDDLRQRGVVTAALTPLPPATETGAAGFEDEATHPFRRPEAQAEGHPRSERVAGDVHPLQALRIQEREELIQRPIEGGVARDGALAVT